MKGRRAMTTTTLGAEDCTAILPAPFGALGMHEHAGQVDEICFLPPGTATRETSSPASRALIGQLTRYLATPEHVFDISALLLTPRGTAFQRRVWQAIRHIPPGTVRTYADLAQLLGSAPRAIGQACGANPFPLVVPCHRVVSSSGLGGFAHARDGFLLDTKRWLLHHEGVL
jgi:methylated-DNA-[protein]-cysteine S-methyltransferase